MTDDDTTKGAGTGTADSIEADATVASDTTTDAGTDAGPAKGPAQKPGEIGGPQGPEPTRYGDWEFKGRCTDF